MRIERQDLNFDVYEWDRKIIHVEYHKEKDETVVNVFQKHNGFMSAVRENSWENIEGFLSCRIVNCNPKDPIEYLKKTKGKLALDPISIKFNQ